MVDNIGNDSTLDLDDKTYGAFLKFSTKLQAVEAQRTLLMGCLEDLIEEHIKGNTPLQKVDLPDDYTDYYYASLSLLTDAITDAKEFIEMADADRKLMDQLFNDMGIEPDKAPPPVKLDSIALYDETLTESYSVFMNQVQTMFELHGVTFPKELLDAHDALVRDAIPMQEMPILRLLKKEDKPTEVRRLGFDPSLVRDSQQNMSVEEDATHLSKTDIKLVEMLQGRVSGCQMTGQYLQGWIENNLNGKSLSDSDSVQLLNQIYQQDHELQTALMELESMLQFFSVPEDVRQKAVNISKVSGEKEGKNIARKLPIRITQDSLLEREAVVTAAFDNLIITLESLAQNMGVELPDNFDEMTATFRKPMAEAIKEIENFKEPNLKLTEVAKAERQALQNSQDQSPKK